MATKKHLLQAAAGAGGGGWDISTAVYNGSPVNWFPTPLEQITVESIFFKPDGTKMYFIGATNDAVNEYDLSTAWDISTATHVQNFSVTTQETSPFGLFFKTDGTEMYVIGAASGSIHQYTLSTAWNISTASLTRSLSVSSNESSPRGLSFSPDGTHMYYVGSTNDTVWHFALGTAWDISTGSFQNQATISSQDGIPEDLFFKSDGTKMYIIGNTNDSVYEYTLSTAWDLNSISYVQSFSVATNAPNPNGLFFSSDGTKMYVAAITYDQVVKYDLSTAWDISTASFSYPTTDYFSVVSQDATPFGLFFKPDGTKMYIAGYDNDSIFEYDLSTAWNIATASYVQGFNVTTQDPNPSGLFFKPDGTKMYMIGFGYAFIHEYILSTAWDISTSVYNTGFDVSSQDANALGLFFKPDGTKVYFNGGSTDTVYEYSLGTAWNISTMNSNQSFSVSSQDGYPVGLFFKPDGTIMYITGDTNNKIYEYSLSTAWDITTASYVQEFSVNNEALIPYGLSFKNDGTKMYITDSNLNSIFSYDL